MNQEKIERWLSHFGLATYLLFLLSMFLGEYVAYAMIIFVFVGGTPLALLWTVSHFRLQGVKMPSLSMLHRSQGKASMKTEDLEEIIKAYKKKRDEQKAEASLSMNVETESKESEINDLLRKAVSHSA